MIVSVTGGTGFIGQRLMAALTAAGHEVRVLSRKAAGGNGPVAGVRHVQGDLAAGSDLSEFLDGASVLFHCAGEISDPSRMEALHVHGTQHLIRAATGKIGRWVQLSSTGAYGPRRRGEVLEGDRLEPVGPYEITKARSDELVGAAARQGAFSCSILRPSIVFGAGMPNQSLFAMLRMIEKRLFFFIGRPGASANYVHVNNVIQALLDCGFKPEADAQIFNLSDYCTMEAFVQYMAKALGVPAPALRVPEGPMRLAARLLEPLPGWPLKGSRVDALTSFVRFPTTKIEQTLQYRHRLSMADGIADLVRDYRKRSS